MIRALITALLVGLPTLAAAHEIGKTQVTATFHRDGTYQIDMAVDPDAFLAKLEALAGVPASGAATTRERATRIEALQRTFLACTVIAFDGVPVEPRSEYLESVSPSSWLPPSGGRASDAGLVRLTGTVPSGARAFTWRSTLVFGSYALVIKTDETADGSTQWLEGGRESEPFLLGSAVAPAGRFAVARQYLALGFTHILPKGLDHILFVLGIFLLTTRARSVLAQVTAFTIAHSITLGLTIYGIVSLSPSIVEPLIALSIAYVAIENLLTSELKPWRVGLVFGFGLLHGMGFAGVLRELGLPRSEFLTALVTFNLGVEAGQLAVIGLAALALSYWRSPAFAKATAGKRGTYRWLIVVPASLVIAATGLYWTYERLRPGFGPL